ncbi:hypothetical protein ID858_17885 [Xenorhabdus sp. DI]|uniref:hypothetical protein n=1 Tax=Xenorhabdus doucetiae TaxID=351671 RepID=UPI001991A529|nr:MULTISPECIES: hypothetical protein [unclassified Xenorhabdus]MBD2786642.1 hypothetical protein [Xenorhabdus sp. 3]MBD2790357.1 hypothetical protein [Xenorhabdus sp. DI]
MAQDRHDRRSRLPRGVISTKQVALRLSLEEDAELEEIAREENRSKASLARIYYLAGKQAAQAKAEAQAEQVQ